MRKREDTERGEREWEEREERERIERRVLGVRWEWEAGGEVVVEWKDAEHQKRAVSGAFLVFERMG